MVLAEVGETTHLVLNGVCGAENRAFFNRAKTCGLAFPAHCANEVAVGFRKEFKGNPEFNLLGKPELPPQL